MKYICLLLALLIAVAAASTLSGEQKQFLFTKWVQNHQKQYETNNMFKKFDTFSKNLDLIIAHNAKGLSFTMGLNQFADMTAEEFASSMIGFKMPSMKTQGVQEDLEAMLASPNGKVSIDWRSKMNPVQNQASCGSCWAFSTVGTIEGQYNVDNGKLYKLSEQQLVSCSKQNSGCNGGLMRTAAEDIVTLGGITTEDQWPYKALNGKCDQQVTPVIKSLKYTYIKDTSAAHIEALKKGPIAIAVNAGSSGFQFYAGGVLDSCRFSGYDHAIVMVGVEATDGEGYFTIRNSWGSSWGEAGHIRVKISDNKSVNCGAGTCDEDGQVSF